MISNPSYSCQQLKKISLISFYHRECRSAFTHKKTLISLKGKSANTEQDSPQEKQWASQRQPTSSSSRVYEKICIFCEKGNKNIKRSHSREPLIQASELRADEKVRAVATIKMDNKILAVTSRELVAAEAHYHKTCYRDYTREYYSQTSIKSATVEDGDRTYADVEDDAYQMLFANIRDELFPNPRVLTMVELTASLVLYMKTHGMEEVQASTKKHIGRKLQGELKESLLISPDDTGKLLVIPDNLKITMLAAEHMRLKGELNSLKDSTDPLQLIRKAAAYIRAELKKSEAEANLVWPPQPQELDKDYRPLTPFLTEFLKTLVAGDHDSEKPLTSRVHRFIYSVSQDFMFAVSGGSCSTAKHILLPWAVKALTGNVKVIKLLSRLGHGISYSKLEEIETALCLKKIESEEEMAVNLPSNVYPGVPTTLAFDNIDRLEETLSRGGTSNQVNGIVIQQMVRTVETPTPATMPNQKKRSITQTQFVLPSINAGERVGPPALRPMSLDCSDPVKTAQMKNFTWHMIRQINTTEQSVCGWTGFNIMTRDKIAVNQDTGGYLPTINAPATAMSTVNEILTQALKTA